MIGFNKEDSIRIRFVYPKVILILQTLFINSARSSVALNLGSTNYFRAILHVFGFLLRERRGRLTQNAFEILRSCSGLNEFVAHVAV